MPRPSHPTPFVQSASPTRAWSAAAIGVTVAGVVYNGVLAFLFARGFPMSSSIVAVSEMAILSVAVGLLLLTRFEPTDIVPVGFGYLGIAIAVVMSLVNQRFFVDGARIFAIVAIFVLLGSRLRMPSVDRCFVILTSVVLGVLIVELASTPLYVWIFKPAAYYEATRGVEKFFLNKSGLFRNSLGFQGRLSLNPFSDFRTSSIFIEQVSLANYAGVLIVFLLTRWRALARNVRILHAVALVLILLTNSTRTSIGLAMIGLLGYWIYPRLNRMATLAVAPVLLAISLATVLFGNASTSDDIAGRLSKTIGALRALGADSLLGARVDLLPQYGDSGYPYLITATTVVGAFAFWLFASLLLRQRTIDEKRCAWAAALYFFINLLIGGTAVFSIKVAAPLWLLIGCLYARSAEDAVTEPKRAVA